MCPLKEAIEYGIDLWEDDHQCLVNQYIEDMTEEEFDNIENYSVVSDVDLTQETPCGVYHYLRKSKEFR